MPMSRAWAGLIALHRYHQALGFAEVVSDYFGLKYKALVRLQVSATKVRPGSKKAASAAATCRAIAAFFSGLLFRS